MKTTSEKRQVHLVGSVPLKSAEDVFRTSGSLMGDCLARLPDGETGNRLQWIMYQYILMSKMPAFEVVAGTVSGQELTAEIEAFIAQPERGFDMANRQLQVKESIDIADIVFGELGYAKLAKASYSKFSALRESGEVPEDCRFQVSLPTPLAPIQTFISPKSYSDSIAIYKQYKKAMIEEIRRLTDAIPASDLAIQWDVCIEIIMLENRQNDADIETWREEIPKELSLLAELIPEPCELGFHFCYGDMGHKHFVEPADTALMTGLANTLSVGVSRSIQWIHMPVPRERKDSAYFEPLGELRLKPETCLFLGLVHQTDGLQGALERVDSACRTVSDFGVATECGLGRRDPVSIPDLLKLHVQVASQG